jgi:hypothetical protein
MVKMKIPGIGLASYFKGELIFLKESTVSFWDVKNQKCIRTVELTDRVEFNYCQIIVLEDEFFIIDIKNSKLLYYNSDRTLLDILIPEIKSIGSFCVANKNQNEIFFLSGLEFNVFDKMSLRYETASGISIRKFAPHFRDLTTGLFCYSYSILAFSSNCEKLLYHNHHDGKENRLGVYDSKEKVSITEFETPQEFETVNWNSGIPLDNYLKAYKAIQGCLLKDKIVVCFSKSLYIIDYQGNVVKCETLKDDNSYNGVCQINDNSFLVSISDVLNNSDTEIVIFDCAEAI